MNLPLQAPLHIADAIRTACKRVSPNGNPFYLSIEPESGLMPNHCFPNIEAKIGSDRGAAVFGWAVYIMPRLWIEFQSHVVWKAPDGTIHDPTPRHDGEKAVLFLPDEWEYAGQAPPTQFFPLTSDPRLLQMLELQKQINVLWAENRPDYATPATKWPIQMSRIRDIETEKAVLFSELRYSVERNDPCPCLSRKKFKQCCGR